MCRPLKCAPVIRGCGGLKVLFGLVLLGVAGWMLANPWSLNCDALGSTCPGAAQEMLETYHNSTTFNTGPESAEIANFCDCITSCVNYVTVYEANKLSPEPSNCYTYSQQMGIPLVPVNERRLTTKLLGAGMDALTERRLGDGGNSIPGMPKNECTTCEGLETGQLNMFNAFAGGAALCGVLLMITAGCEYGEIKHHTKCYSFAVIVIDIVASTILFSAAVGSTTFAALATAACDPDAVKAPIEDAGTDSTAGNSDAAAAFAYFLLKLIAPVVEGVCSQRKALFLYSVSTTFGFVCSTVTFTASLCLCLHCTDDGIGYTPDDMRTQQLHALHATDSGTDYVH